MGKKILYIFILSMLSACSSTGNSSKININKEYIEKIKNGKCEEKIPEISGTKGIDIIIWANNAIDQIHICREEKLASIKIIEEYINAE